MLCIKVYYDNGPALIFQSGATNADIFIKLLEKPSFNTPRKENIL